MDENNDTMSISPGLLPGALHEANKLVQDWSCNGLIGYGYRSKVVIMDPATVQVLKTIVCAQEPITALKWAPKSIKCQSSLLSLTVIAFGDNMGEIFVYDVSTSTLIAHMSDKNGTINSIHWIKFVSSKDYNLLTLSDHRNLMLWDYITGATIWKHRSYEELTSLSLNPNDNSKLTVFCNDWVQEWQELRMEKFSCMATEKIYLSFVPLGTNTKAILSTKPTQNNNSNTMLVENIIAATYMTTVRNFMVLTTTSHVVVVDMKFYVAVCCFRIDIRTIQVIPYRTRDALLTVSERGMISLYVAKKTITHNSDHDKTYASTPSSNDQLSSSIIYQHDENSNVTHAEYKMCHLFLSNHWRLPAIKTCYGVVINPINELDIALFCNNGSVAIQTLKCRENIPFCEGSNENTFSNVNSILSDFNETVDYNANKSSYYLLMLKLFTPLHQAPTCLGVCPIIKYRINNMFMPVCAVGFKSGVVQIVDLIHCSVLKSIVVSNKTIRKIVWVTMETLIILAKNDNATVGKTDLRIVNINSGHVTRIPITVPQPEAIITNFKVSNMRKYMCITFKNYPSQFWSLDPLAFIHNVSSSFITECEWSSGLVKQTSALISPTSTSSMVITTNATEGGDSIVIREHLFCADANGMVRHFMMDKDTPTEQSNMSLDSSIGTVSCMSWKVEYLILGDNLGNITIWSFKNKQSKTFSMKANGAVSKIIFAPGKSFYKFVVLFADVFQIWDASTENLIQTFRWSRQHHPIDIEWLSQELLVAINEEGSLITFSCTTITNISIVFENTQLAHVILPSLLQSQCRDILRTALMLPQWLLKDFQLSTITSTSNINDETVKTLQHLLDLIRDKYPILNTAIPTVTRALYVSMIIGDSSEIAFWTLVAYSTAIYCQTDLLNESDIDKKSQLLNSIAKGAGIDSLFDRYIPPEIYKKFKLWYTMLIYKLLPAKSYSSKRECVISLVALNQRNEVIQSLLSTDAHDSNCYGDSLRALTIALFASNEDSKLVEHISSSLVSKGKVLEAIELLCFAKKPLEATRSYISLGHIDEAFWLAKTFLDNDQLYDFVNKFIINPENELANNLLKNLTIPLSLSTGKFGEAINILYSHGQWCKAYHLIKVCEELNLIQCKEQFQHIKENYFSWLKTIYIKGDSLKITN